ncbi:MAG TPA: hypothetical protein VG873_14490 [Burkholderiales bacterium]|nr:hypothetical protein [Burkholderiales bacterium]
MSWQILWAQVLGPACKLMVLAASVAGAILGISLLLRPAGTLVRMRGLNRWVSTRRTLKPLEVPRGQHQVVRGRRLWAGLVIAGGGAYVLIVLLWSFDPARLGAAMGGTVLSRIAIDWLRWTLVAGSILVAAVGLLMALAPRALETFETWSNRWVSTRKALQGSDTQYLVLDGLVERFPRGAGALLLAFSLAAAAASLVLLAQR